MQLLPDVPTLSLRAQLFRGGCWQGNYDQALASIRKLKRLGASEGAQVWPNHDFAFYRSLPAFPDWCA